MGRFILSSGVKQGMKTSGLGIACEKKAKEKGRRGGVVATPEFLLAVARFKRDLPFMTIDACARKHGISNSVAYKIQREFSWRWVKPAKEGE